MPMLLASNLVPKNGATFSLLEDSYIKGGFHAFATIAQRDALDSSCLKDGTVCRVVETGKLYVYEGLVWSELVLGGSSKLSRVKYEVAVANVAINTPTIFSLPVPASGHVVDVQALANGVSAPSWVRFYVTNAGATLDKDRSISVDAPAEAGELFEVVTGASQPAIILAPVTTYATDGVDKKVYGVITNLETSTLTFTVQLTILGLE